ncbi:unnamed protein product [Adineta ricciae]|uniref:Uncharacterized protein n=1 Tax=Adineta ricciae TaxID=249248 RepID=A0A813SL97_ADIRI|nr:unnamed protein product [Adineta ricciae]CAF1324866.1 unnamed protein product [Adineta ricciae]
MEVRHSTSLTNNLSRPTIALSEDEREISPGRTTSRTRNSKTNSSRDKKNTRSRPKKYRPPLTRTTQVMSNAIRFVDECHLKSISSDQIAGEHPHNVQRPTIRQARMSFDETKMNENLIRTRILSSEEVEEKMTRLEEKLKGDQELDMTGILNLSSMNLIDNDLSLIIQQIFYNQRKHCTGLILRNNFISSAGVKMLVEELLLTKTNLKFLSLANNSNVGDSAVVELIRYLEINHCLTLLALPQTGITDYGVRLLADVLCGINTDFMCSTLEKLDISFNKFITDQSLEALLNIVMQNETLKELSIQHCSMSDEILQELKQSNTRKRKRKLIFSE